MVQMENGNLKGASPCHDKILKYKMFELFEFNNRVVKWS